MVRRTLVSIVIAVAGIAPVAQAAPPSKGFGPGIDAYPSYDGQSKCSPDAKPGVAAFARMVMKAYPGTGSFGIGRACSVGGQSEHKEGRAFDWAVNAGVPYQRRAAESLISWLTKRDGYGNEKAMARRLGVMYVIWNRRIWFPWGGWETYCVQKPYGCHAPGERRSLRHPHTDHVHISFTWAGARKKTTYWNRDRSMLGAIASPGRGGGYWLLARNGAIATGGTSFFGSRADKPSKDPLVGMAARPNGDGYWLVGRDGRVSAYGAARNRGSAKGETKNVDDIVATRSGRGYWLATRKGRVFAYGNAPYLGGLAGEESGRVVGMASTPTSKGYWLVTEKGRVAAFGDAADLGGLVGEASDVQGIVASPAGGYWLFTENGRVAPFGPARTFGGLVGKTKQPIVSMASTKTGLGYWLLGEKGRIGGFGDATKPRGGSLAPLAKPVPPSGLMPELPMD
ncbi:MAG: hypothetical protein ACRDLB_13355 [Actinomycetota bacterium]